MNSPEKRVLGERQVVCLGGLPFDVVDMAGAVAKIAQAAATRAWTALSGRFRYLGPLSHSIIPVQSGGRTLYRLRASGPDAASVCRRLQVAGEDCATIG